MLFKVVSLVRIQRKSMEIIKRTATTNTSGIILPKPERESFGLVKTCLTVVFGILIGAMISKNVANFLEENELFVPSEEDDDDD